MPGLALGEVTQGGGTVLSDQEEGALTQDLLLGSRPRTGSHIFLNDSWPPL